VFEVSIVARSPNEDLDLEAIVGKPAAFRLHTRRWTGVCSHVEQAQAETTGLSTYHLPIVPDLWLLGQRHNYRIFQHLSVPEIAGALVGEWGIDPSWKVDRRQHPKLEIRVQYVGVAQMMLPRSNVVASGLLAAILTALRAATAQTTADSAATA